MIYDGKWPRGSKIPSENELAAMLGTSRGTIQKALDTLVGEGLLRQVKGSGTYVTRPQMHYTTGGRFLSFAEWFHAQGVAFTTEVLCHELTHGFGTSMNDVVLDPNALVLNLERVRRSDTEALVYQEDRVSLDSCPGIDTVDLSIRPLFDAIQETSGRTISYAEANFAARVAGRRRAQILGCAATTPVLNLEMVIYLDDGQIAEWENAWMPSNRFVLSTILQRF
jgi:DNA-binding GntR family transcriptional regulator